MTLNSKWFLFLLFAIYCLVCSLFCFNHETDSTLVKVAFVHRHGDRAPYAPKTNIDPVQWEDERFWPEGFAELTAEGKKKMYRLGKFIQNRYKDLLPDDPRQVSIKSSSSVRCIMSSQCLLAGAFPPTGRNVIDPDLKWQPFEIQVNDSMVNFQSPCKKRDDLRDRLRHEGDQLQLNQKHQKFYHFLETHTARSIKNTFDVLILHDTLHLAEQAGMKLPDWATEEVMQQLLEIGVMEFVFEAETLEQRRLTGGLFFQDILDNFRNKTPSNPEKKVLFYSTHDMNIALLLQVLNNYVPKITPFGATIIFELHREQQNAVENDFVKIYYLEEPDSEVLKAITVPGCSHDCSLEKFGQFLQPVLIDKMEHECGL